MYTVESLLKVYKCQNSWQFPTLDTLYLRRLSTNICCAVDLPGLNPFWFLHRIVSISGLNRFRIILFRALATRDDILIPR